MTDLKAYENNKMFVFFKVRILVRIMKNHIFSVFLQYFHQQNSIFWPLDKGITLFSKNIFEKTENTVKNMYYIFNSYDFFVFSPLLSD